MMSCYMHRSGGNTVPARNGGGKKSILIAAALGRVDVIRLLHELGGDLNDADEHGCTPVYFAAVYGHVEAIRTLCKLGADLLASVATLEGSLESGVLLGGRMRHDDVLCVTSAGF
jgi:ankyrin repeat protein